VKRSRHWAVRPDTHVVLDAEKWFSNGYSIACDGRRQNLGRFTEGKQHVENMMGAALAATAGQSEAVKGSCIGRVRCRGSGRFRQLR
jgi:hypothetical protein